jgi:hypothetical protein
VSDISAVGQARKRRARSVVAAAATLTAAAAFATPAGAAVTAPHVIAPLYNGSALELSGYTPNKALTVQISRGGSVIGTASGTTTLDPKLGDGVLNVNGGVAGDACWVGTTPEILPGDTVTVSGDGAPDTMVVQDVFAGTPAVNALGQLEVHGHAADPAGNPLPVDLVENRIIGAARFSNGKNRIGTQHAGIANEGTLSYDIAGSTAWTAVYPSLSDADKANALDAASVSRGLYNNDPLAPTETTISLNPGAPGPDLVGCTAPLARHAVTSTDHTPAINIANQNTDLTVSGVSSGATSVSVTLNDGTTTLTSTATVAAGGNSWSAVFPSAGVRTLKDGVLTASGSYTTPSATVTGAPLQIPKDTVAPGAATATPGTGTYTGTRQVTLSSADATATIRFTTDGSVPTSASPAASGQIAVATSLRLRAVAIDPAGNAGPISTFDYVINQPVTPRLPSAGTTGGTDATGAAAGSTAAAPTAAAKPTAPAALAPAGAVAGPAAKAPGVGVLSVRGRLTIGTLRRQGLRVGMRLNPGTKVVSVRIYRVVKGRSVGTPLVSVQSLPAAASAYTVALKPTQVKRIGAGKYVIQVRARGTNTAFGQATNVLIAVAR